MAISQSVADGASGTAPMRRRDSLLPRCKVSQMQRLIDDMIETMIDYEGIGLAAPQVFESLRLIVLGDPDSRSLEDEAAIPLTVLFNPQFTTLSPERLDAWEGCLSIPQLRGVVPRSTAVEVQGYDREGQRGGTGSRRAFRPCPPARNRPSRRRTLLRPHGRSTDPYFRRGIPALLARCRSVRPPGRLDNRLRPRTMFSFIPQSPQIGPWIPASHSNKARAFTLATS